MIIGRPGILGEIDDAMGSSSTEDGAVSSIPESNAMQDGDGARNFCGRTIDEAMETCSRDLHCPSGLNGEW